MKITNDSLGKRKIKDTARKFVNQIDIVHKLGVLFTKPNITPISVISELKNVR